MRNEYEIRGDITAIFLKRPNGDVLETIIDTSDLEKAISFPYTWYPKYSDSAKVFYVWGATYLGNKKQKIIHLSRFLMGDDQRDKEVDHINHDTLNNRRSCNLRWLTHGQNQINSNGLYKNNKSGAKGVSWDKNMRRWKVQIKREGKVKHCGYFTDLQEAIEHSTKIREEVGA